MIRTQILLTPELYEEVKAEAQRKKTSISSVVRESVHKTLVKKKKSSRDILLAMAAEAASDPNIPRDLSSNDDYLYKLP